MKKLVTFRVKVLIESATKGGFDECVLDIIKRGFYLKVGGASITNGSYSYQTKKTEFQSSNKVK